MTKLPLHHFAFILATPALLLCVSDLQAGSPTTSAQQPVPLPPVSLEAPGAEFLSQPLAEADLHGSWGHRLPESVVEIPSSVLDEAEWMTSPVETANYDALSDSDVPVQPISLQVGSVSIVPYGILWGDMLWGTERWFPGSFVLWVQSRELQGENEYVADARRSRVGINIKGPKVNVLGGLTGGGKVEVNFLGGFVNENTTDVRLRHVYWEAKNESVRFLVGQTWDVVSPRLPNTVNFSVGWAGGNVGFRRTQFRVERHVQLGGGASMEFQLAAAQNIIPDLASGFLATGVIRETGGWPMIQGRTAVTFGGDGLLPEPMTVGVSGHIGETGFDFLLPAPGPERDVLGPADDQRFKSWSFNIDTYVPLTEWMGFHGEFFTGADLSNILGGIGQGVCPCLRVPIRSTGGWAEVWCDLTPCVTTHAGFGIDDPNDEDSLIGRTYNRFVYVNMFLDVTQYLKTGFEVSHWKTNYHNKTLSEPDPDDRIDGPTEPGESLILDWTVQYRF